MPLRALDRTGVRFVGFLGVGTTTIVTSIATCPNPGRCLQRLLQPATWPEVLWVLTLLVLSLGIAWLTWLSCSLARASFRARRFSSAAQPSPRLVAAIRRTGVRRVRCVSSSAPIAFCTGGLRPVILVSEGLAQRLGDDELDAVLVHEQQHAREREPLVRAAADAAAAMLFFVPVARWWSRRRIEEAELRADRAAVRQVGRRPVAAALCALDATMPGEAAFAGVARLRVAQLLGEPLPVQRPAAWLIAASLIGFPFAVAMFWCLVQAVNRISGM